MRCIYCNNKVVGKDPITVPEKGISHFMCHEKFLKDNKFFMGISIKSLTTKDITNLKKIIDDEIKNRY